MTRLSPPAIRRRLALVIGIMVAVPILIWISESYLHPDLRKAIIFSGLGLC